MSGTQPTNGFPNGTLPNGHTPNGQIPNGHTPNGTTDGDHPQVNGDSRRSSLEDEEPPVFRPVTPVDQRSVSPGSVPSQNGTVVRGHAQTNGYAQTNGHSTRPLPVTPVNQRSLFADLAQARQAANEEVQSLRDPRRNGVQIAQPAASSVFGPAPVTHGTAEARANAREAWLRPLREARIGDREVRQLEANVAREVRASPVFAGLNTPVPNLTLAHPSQSAPTLFGSFGGNPPTQTNGHDGSSLFGGSPLAQANGYAQTNGHAHTNGQAASPLFRHIDWGQGIVPAQPEDARSPLFGRTPSPQETAPTQTNGQAASPLFGGSPPDAPAQAQADTASLPDAEHSVPVAFGHSGLARRASARVGRAIDRAETFFDGTGRRIRGAFRRGGGNSGGGPASGSNGGNGVNGA
ncbi:hypothetical protein GGR57DRAFT_106109 [Xylariaceae sp. FL1272]|nr:hypothetical protein GGR57DRAFT_106109 [Xylariaceae sp. FL1272]